MRPWIITAFTNEAAGVGSCGLGGLLDIAVETEEVEQHGVEIPPVAIA